MRIAKEQQQHKLGPVQTPILIAFELSSNAKNARFDQTAYKIPSNNLCISRYMKGSESESEPFQSHSKGEILGRARRKERIIEPFQIETGVPNCWFSHDVTKIQTKKLSILPRFYFHDALEQLKTNFHTNFRFKRVLGFVIEDA